MKVFITGIAGFIGDALALALDKKGVYVAGVDNLFSGFEENIPSTIPWEKGDISNVEDFNSFSEEFDIIIHLAAQTSGEKSFEIPIYDMETNLKGSYNVYGFAKKCGAKLMINMSSMSVYGDVPDKQVVSEAFCPKPVSLYGNTKYAAENMLAALSKIDGLPVISLRLFNAYGPKQDLRELKQGMVSIYLSYLLNEPKIHVKGDLDRVRDLIYVDDIINAIFAILDSKKWETDVFNLSSNTIFSVESLIQKMMNVSGITKPIFCSGTTCGDVAGFGGDNSKFKERFNWQPSISLETGLEKMISYYR